MNNNNKELLSGNVYTKISEYLSEIDKGIVDYYIGLAFLSKFKDFPDINIEEIAYLANTTKSSVTKFCRKIGYDSFLALRNDIWNYTEGTFFTQLNKQMFQSLEDYFTAYEEMDHDLMRRIIASLDQNLIQKVAKEISRNKNILFIAADYNKNLVSVFGELLFIHDIILTVVNRENDESDILKAAKNADIILTSCLSGRWVEKHQPLITALNKPFYIITMEYSHDDHIIGLLPDPVLPPGGSFYKTQRYLQTIFYLINYYILKERNQM